MKCCLLGWFKNDIDVCDLCVVYCVECLGKSYWCIKCKVLRFLVNNICVDKCVDGEYGYLFSRECWKCSIEECIICVNGNDGNNCIICKLFKVLKKGSCEKMCVFDLYEKNGVCV